MGGRVKTPKAELWRAIRRKCVDCSAGSRKEVDLCPIPECSLYPFRYGKPPIERV